MRQAIAWLSLTADACGTNQFDSPAKGRRPRITKTEGFVNGIPLVLLRLEGFAIELVLIAAFRRSGASWQLFATLILAPDLSILFYLAGPRMGAAFYNAAHLYLGPIALFAASAELAVPVGMAAALVWCAQIGIDRALGFGLKYNGGFTLTHLGRIGHQAPG